MELDEAQRAQFEKWATSGNFSELPFCLETEPTGTLYIVGDTQDCWEAWQAASAATAADDRECLAAWMIANSFATGHGDTLQDLLSELGWQVKAIRSRQEQGKEKL